ncbi:aspartate/glutamate racemase family protein [Aquisalimonas asiatica]|uniref:Hydantoin racemase n=1 Tax=Aquisalimonas asiatica TaxID=406100 RepID=A0A1H8SUY7_9GAMM|nr:aspartate/glutamate racemase family protein [Aquisalimonas asiatica]SEO82168.1 allantoin racemase [Aquisalimonas asiatica]
MRIQVINPNTSAHMTDAIGDAARAVAGPGTEILAVNPADGPPSIEGHYDEAMAVPGMLAKVHDGEQAGVDGHVIACFGDPGLMAAREVAAGPVIGIAEAAMHMASLIAPRFAVVTTLDRTRIIAAHLAEQYGMARHCCAIRATEIAVLELDDPASDARARITAECRAAIEQDRAEALVLGCAGMADLPRALSDELGVPVIDGVGAAVKLVESLVGMGLGTSKAGDLAYPVAKTYTGDLGRFSP